MKVKKWIKTQFLIYSLSSVFSNSLAKEHKTLFRYIMVINKQLSPSIKIVWTSFPKNDYIFFILQNETLQNNVLGSEMVRKLLFCASTQLNKGLQICFAIKILICNQNPQCFEYTYYYIILRPQAFYSSLWLQFQKIILTTRNRVLIQNL